MVVYKIINLLNEKIYICQTKQPIEKRFLQHSKANSPLGQAMRDCGLENFTIEVIERCENQNELNEREKFWIKKLNCKIQNGYSIASGGQYDCKIKKISTNKKAFTMRLDWQNYEKFIVISKKNRRSMAAELELLVEQYISNYESQNGQILLTVDETQKNSAVVNNQFGNHNLQVTTI